MRSLDSRIRALMKAHPPLRKGALRWRELSGLAHRVVNRLQAELGVQRLECRVKLRPYPFGGSVARIGNRIIFTVDSRLDEFSRRQVLAHEIGHVALGHYALDSEVYYYHDDPLDDPLETEANAFELIALRSMYFPVEWIVDPEQLDLRIPRPHVTPGERDVKAEIDQIYRRRRIRTAGTGKPSPKVAELLKLFEDERF